MRFNGGVNSLLPESYCKGRQGVEMEPARVGDDLVVEIKSVEQILRVHEAQILTYLRLSGRWVALLLNFNSVLLKHGIKRFINSIAP